ncbi:thiamine ABC transporter substrate-binding protein [Nakamurella sp. A5-74]|uniref:Thiamine ABC transporter substrate-binding protein n=1 Tax=Nakamurella sp. A5-74 TaxID=3158264 RepID=A0AAU8DKZ7_9ACTN
MTKDVVAKFQQDTGITLKIIAQGDAGAMVNQLVLTKNKPLGDVAFGVDNTFASRALDEGVFAPYTSPAAGNGSTTYSAATDGRLTAVDYSDACVNVDEKWFAGKNIQPPTSYEDLTQPQYKNLFVVPSPATSSPGLAFLLGTIAHFGADKWQAYWQQLKDNGVKITAGWNDAYTVDFSGSTGKGDRPLVLSYASSPPFEAAAGDTAAPTAALLDTCFRQIEYVGVLEGAQNPTGAQKVVDWMLSNGFQAAVPEQMYVYPVDAHTALPADWKKFAPVATAPAEMDPAEITANREGWISSWSDLMES